MRLHAVERDELPRFCDLRFPFLSPEPGAFFLDNNTEKPVSDERPGFPSIRPTLRGYNVRGVFHAVDRSRLAEFPRYRSIVIAEFPRYRSIVMRLHAVDRDEAPRCRP